jgi:hypothetical protein
MMRISTRKGFKRGKSDRIWFIFLSFFFMPPAYLVLTRHSAPNSSLVSIHQYHLLDSSVSPPLSEDRRDIITPSPLLSSRLPESSMKTISARLWPFSNDPSPLLRKCHSRKSLSISNRLVFLKKHDRASDYLIEFIVFNLRMSSNCPNPRFYLSTIMDPL